jgi:hypothetical protein
MLIDLSNHDLGVVGIENNKVVGFITCYSPINELFAKSKGVFSPIHAHGAINENRGYIYSKLYQSVAKKWVQEGIFSHAIALYAHDKETIESLFWNNFGLRCIDAIRETSPIYIKQTSLCTYSELTDNEIKDIVDMENDLVTHLCDTPMFMPRTPNNTYQQLLKQKNEDKCRFFGARYKDNIVGFIKIKNSGENFACDNTKMTNIYGAYLIPQYRGNGIYQVLLSYIQKRRLY